MRIKWKYALFVLVALVVVSNIFSAYIRALWEGPSLIYAFETQNAEFRFVVDPDQGMGHERMQEEFGKFLRLHPGTGETELYRTFEMEPWKFWNWYHYLSSELYTYPYKEYSTSP